MLIINGGMPRSGTVLVGNVVRLMLERRSIPWQRYNPQERRHLPEFLERTRRTIEGALIVHTHLIDAAIIKQLSARNDAVLIWNHRDPRDALVSLMQLHDMTLAHGLRAMDVYGDATAIAHASPDVIRISYEALVQDLPTHIEALASALQFDPKDGEIDELIKLTSPSAHSNIMNRLTAEAGNDVRVIKTMRRVLREDPTTLINDRHIQSGRSGRWQRELSAEAQAHATASLARWISLLGYEPTPTG